jgi:hypothetical protein
MDVDSLHDLHKLGEADSKCFLGCHRCQPFRPPIALTGVALTRGRIWRRCPQEPPKAVGLREQKFI